MASHSPADSGIVQFLIVAILIGGSAFVNWLKATAEKRKRALDADRRMRPAAPPPPRAPPAQDPVAKIREMLETVQRPAPPPPPPPPRVERPRRVKRIEPPPPPPVVVAVAPPPLEEKKKTKKRRRAPAAGGGLLRPEVAARLTEAQRMIVAAEIFRRPRRKLAPKPERPARPPAS